MLEEKTYKNWNELCKVLGWKITRGNTKKKYLKELESSCDFYREGNKYVIKKIYNEPKPIEDKRKHKPTKEDEKYGENMLKGGVYRIIKNNTVYIGSTNNFRQRLIQHRAGDLPTTKNFLNQGAEFEILKVVEENRVEWEQKYIDRHIILGYKVINKKRAKDSTKNSIAKITIPLDKLDEAIEVLKEEGIEILNAQSKFERIAELEEENRRLREGLK